MRATDVPRLDYAPASSAEIEPTEQPQVAPPPTPPEAPQPLSPGPARACDRVLSFVDRHRYKLFLALAALYLLGFNGQWRPEPDSALYLVIGRNIALGEGYTYHGVSHRLVFPGL